MSQGTGHYYVPAPSKWPIVGSSALFFLGFGAAFTMNKIPAGYYMLGIGFAILIYMLFGWFGEVARESEAGKYGKVEDKSFRWGMSWFIFSEVMFFSAFFGALYYMRVLTIPELADVEHDLLWPSFTGGWPTAGPGITEKFTPMGAWGLPAFNTFLLLSSGVTVTLAHWALKENRRPALKMWLLATVALGFTFLACQIYEYSHAYSDLNLKLTSGAYGSTFYMLTGFHGFHVTLGAIMLTVIYFRCAAGHFKPEHHFGFEGVAWYWHFVDVVWLGLFIFVYLL
ncbi:MULTISPECIES: cytochrome c oxidase subunit 3 [Nitrosomonas]|uniref:cytochrome-c oxidase n=1 Tax=Nitrosomonas communis TaxID=44574 RepID=A0A0F7KK45_9PROT|nr:MULTISPECIES: cytochrome c oxidase subunit 3 [Nitrosomonas]AKH39227.1 MFS transporter [Nitrosomonas communis]TYP88694.1 cytochrome c oxidase subunit 3 [Nitrosomonas communis]UVS61429.1 cytochrome c oxidase subunit 3 [Nitrosomonas sp. PLL12]SDW53159.1 cytochrome c oxidase subunit 3 [Nitrosomonas communis]